MDAAARPPVLRGRPLWAKVLIGVAALAALLALVLVFFPWDVLREPVNRYVSEKTGRHFAITRKLDVRLGRTTRILVDGIEFANPEWAKNPYLVKAEGGEIQVRLWPLIAHRQFVMPVVELRRPQLGLQVEPDGRRSWALGRDTGDRKNVPDIGALVVDQGTLHFVATEHKADIHTEFVIDGPLQMPDRGASAQAASAAASGAVSGGERRQVMPLRFAARGTWQGEPFTAKGRTGNVLYLSAPLRNPFPMEIEAATGATRFSARGAIASLATLEGMNAEVDLSGRNLAELYKLLGVVLPETPQYAVHGRVAKDGEVWRVREIKGRLGRSDIAGELAYDRQKNKPHLVGQLRSNHLDFNDLAPLVGLDDKPRGPRVEKAAEQEVKAATGNPRAKAKKPPRDPNRKVLPNRPIDLARLQAMNSDVRFTAAKVTNVKQLPLERIDVRVRLQDGVLNLDPMNLGMAGGTLAGGMRIDGHSNPAVVEVHLDARGFELNKLLRDVELTKANFGKLYGDIDLKSRGNSVAQMLANADGNLSLLMGPGQISNLLLEVAGLDGAEIIKFLLGRDQNVRVRCGAMSFDVKDGHMTSRAVVLDTVDTVIYGKGSANFGTEQIDLWLHPYPKDKSFLSLRSPINVGGTLGAPSVRPDKGALMQRGAVALALGAIHPLLAIAATIETGPGQDANCGAVLREAANPKSDLRGATDQMAAAQEQAQKMGGPAGKVKSLLGLDDKNRGNEPRAQNAAPAAPGAPASPAPTAPAMGGGSAADTSPAPGRQ